jgi:hypothetical protein
MNSIKRTYVVLEQPEAFDIKLSATHYEPGTSEPSKHFAHFSVRMLSSEVANMTLAQIEAAAIEKAKQMQSE